MASELPRRVVLGATFSMVFAVAAVSLATVLVSAIGGFESPGLLIFGLVGIVTLGSMVALIGAMVFGIPIYLLLQRIGRAGLAWLTLAGMLGGIALRYQIFGNPMHEHEEKFELEFLLHFLLLFVIPGGAAGAGFWFGAERFGREPSGQAGSGESAGQAHADKHDVG